MFDFSQDENDLDDETFDEEKENEFNLGSAIIFLIDGSKQMHDNNYSFKQCLETYQNIVREKCARNRKDKMGLVIFGTEDSNCEIDNIMILQPFDFVAIETLKTAQTLLSEIDKYKQLASDTKYPLYDAIAQAFEFIQTSKKNQKMKNIIVLCTSNDDPCQDVPSELRRIEHLVKTFKDNQTEFRVIGLSDSWNDENLYKDLQIISGTFTYEDYRRIQLADFERTIINPARSISRLQWKISPTISIEVSLYNLISTTTYPKVKMDKDDNEILESRQVLRKQPLEDNSQINADDEILDKKSIVTHSDILHYKSFGDTEILFTPSECKKMKNNGLEPIIEILAFKPILCDPLYHCNSAYYVSYTSMCNEDSKEFFMSFVSKCAEKKVMPICKVVTRFGIAISMMIPSEDDGGFYMYKIPFSDCVRDYSNRLDSFIYNSQDYKCPVNDEAVELFKQLMDLSKIKFDPKSLKNPKLEKHLSHLEAHALGKKPDDIPIDDSDPLPISDEMKSLSERLRNLLDLQSKPSSKKRGAEDPSNSQASKYTRFDMENLAKNRKLQSLKRDELKDFLKSVNAPTTGNKSELIKAINKYFNI